MVDEPHVHSGRVGLPFLRRALGRNLKPEEIESWLLATPVRRAAVVRRLKALRVRSRVASLSPAHRARLAVLTDLTERAFANRYRSWRNDRQLDSLGLGTAARKAAPRKSAEVAAASAAIRRLLARNPGATDERIVTLAMEAGGVAAGLGRSTLRLIVKRARVDEKGQFGGELVFDDVSLALLAPDGRRWRVLLVLDRGTALVCGFALSDSGVSLDLVESAAGDAAARLAGNPLPGLTAASGSPKFLLPTSGDAVAMMRFLADRRGWDSVSGSARTRAAMSVLGGGFGRLRLAPGPDRGRLRTRAEDAMPILFREEAEQLLMLVVARHNRSLLAEDGREDPQVRKRRLMLAECLASSS